MRKTCALYMGKYSILFCFVSSIMGVDLYTNFQKYSIIVFGLKNGGRLIHELTYTRENTVHFYNLKI